MRSIEERKEGNGCHLSEGAPAASSPSRPSPTVPSAAPLRTPAARGRRATHATATGATAPARPREQSQPPRVPAEETLTPCSTPLRTPPSRTAGCAQPARSTADGRIARIVFIFRGMPLVVDFFHSSLDFCRLLCSMLLSFLGFLK
ncbi:sterile alpha motif domain-containing protein 1-like isoform X1 [Prinia subflava]|uniref:sterile alpha motif domain-containing protein 1-like isoform X1 n=1 Tax=Prinia subflava TaxID=208062 RepID=UPI002FE044BC